MTRMDLRYLDPLLALRHVTKVDDEEERDRLMDLVENENPTALFATITEHARFVGCRLDGGEGLIWTSKIEPIDGYVDRTYEYIGQPTVYLSEGDDDQLVADARRLYLLDSLENDAVSQLAGWRDRIVAIIPEEVGPKESKIVRTTAEGNVQTQHEYSVPDAYATYALWVTELAREFGGSDDVIGSARKDAPGLTRGIVHAWLQREAATSQLEQARGSLKFALAGLARTMRRGNPEEMSIAELARSFYTDRANLSRVITSAENDKRIAAILDALEAEDIETVVALMRGRDEGYDE